MIDLSRLSPERPVLIAGPTASGKSGLALEIAEVQGGVIINADALQVYDCWRVLTARPGPDDLARAPHRLYGHVPRDAPYSAGHWLRGVQPLLSASNERPIIVGGTGLYFAALTEGLTEIPEVPAAVRERGDALRQSDFAAMQATLRDADPETAARTDMNNPMRVQRAWEVLTATGRGLRSWQAETPAPLLRPEAAEALVIDADRDWLNQRIATRFEAMIAQGALEEVRDNLDVWDPEAAWARAIGAPELVRHLRGELDLATACDLATQATRQYAKRQRTWFRNRMKAWTAVVRP